MVFIFDYVGSSAQQSTKRFWIYETINGLILEIIWINCNNYWNEPVKVF